MPVVPAHHYRETYSPADLASLAQEFSISPDHRAEMASLLEDTAAIWHWHGVKHSKGPTPAQTARSLSKAAALAHRLSQTVAALPEQALYRLELAIDRAQDEASTAMIMGQPVSDLPAFTSPETDGNELGTLLDVSDILQIVSALERLAKDAAKLPSGSSGAKRDHALRMWIINIELFWVNTLGRVFSRDATSSGEPVSEAARFCVAAFKVASPETPSSRVLNEMKHRIREVSSKSTGRIATENGA
jgi:hypothetical protein